jgi:outer membrane lipoprotein LolB
MKLRKLINITSLLAFFSIISACQNNPKKIIKENYSWNEVSSWSFNGKMFINDTINNGSGKINWKIKPNYIKAQFKSLLGLGGNWKITENNSQAKLESSKNGITIAQNAEQLIALELGSEFPWKSLQYWVRGYKTNQPLKAHDKLPIIINDNGWTITYQKWMETPMGLLPKKIKATKDSYSIKLIIYTWEIPST